MPDQLFQFFIADVVFIGCCAIENANDPSIYLNNKESLRKCLQTKLDRLSSRGFLRRKAGGLDQETLDGSVGRTRLMMSSFIAIA